MFLEERQESIMNMLTRDGKVRVKELSEKFKVTEDCIRKDLGALEKQGRLKRTYGGAVVLRENIHAMEISKHRHSDVEAKRRIAQANSTMRTTTTSTLMITIIELKLADSLMPRMSNKVTATAINAAGKLNTPVATVFPAASFNTVPGGALSANG